MAQLERSIAGVPVEREAGRVAHLVDDLPREREGVQAAVVGAVVVGLDDAGAFVEIADDARAEAEEAKTKAVVTAVAVDDLEMARLGHASVELVTGDHLLRTHHAADRVFAGRRRRPPCEVAPRLGRGRAGAGCRRRVEVDEAPVLDGHPWPEIRVRQVAWCEPVHDADQQILVVERVLEGADLVIDDEEQVLDAIAVEVREPGAVRIPEGGSGAIEEHDLRGEVRVEQRERAIPSGAKHRPGRQATRAPHGNEQVLATIDVDVDRHRHVDVAVGLHDGRGQSKGGGEARHREAEARAGVHEGIRLRVGVAPRQRIGEAVGVQVKKDEPPLARRRQVELHVRPVIAPRVAERLQVIELRDIIACPEEFVHHQLHLAVGVDVDGVQLGVALESRQIRDGLSGGRKSLRGGSPAVEGPDVLVRAFVLALNEIAHAVTVDVGEVCGRRRMHQRRERGKVEWMRHSGVHAGEAATRIREQHTPVGVDRIRVMDEDVHEPILVVIDGRPQLGLDRNRRARMTELVDLAPRTVECWSDFLADVGREEPVGDDVLCCGSGTIRVGHEDVVEPVARHVQGHHAAAR
ncbi:Hypothetical protein CAP_8778 [Chondromyces apiculatus DSM 436]|uniref:Uncharacterized protein n=1 Tax=Chondromyces apiculatus DSM 436 TaxID=1192034 RepID=A0A017SXG8_9BACT|nr:Hypothetical protein CAP_8778 [Chondromyces apiculatus DSM 436]